MYTVQEVIVYIVLIVYREYGEEEEEDGDTHSTIRRQSVIIEGLTMETDELRVRTPTSLFLLYCTDGNTVFRCESDKNSLVIIYMF